MAKGSIQERATRITVDVVRSCDLALLLVDARNGIVPEDEALVGWLRKCMTSPILLAANKAERRGRDGRSGKQMCTSNSRFPRNVRVSILPHAWAQVALITFMV